MRSSSLLAAPLVIWVGLGAHDAAACVCSPLAEEVWPAFGLDLPRLVRRDVYGLSVEPDAHVDLVLRERIGGSFGPPINVRIHVPPS